MGPIYVLTVQYGSALAKVTLHPTFDAAEQCLRKDVDPGDNFTDLDFTGLNDELEKNNIWIDVEAVTLDWPLPQDSWPFIAEVDAFAAAREISRDEAIKWLIGCGLGFYFEVTRHRRRRLGWLGWLWTV